MAVATSRPWWSLQGGKGPVPTISKGTGRRRQEANQQLMVCTHSLHIPRRAFCLARSSRRCHTRHLCEHLCVMGWCSRHAGCQRLKGECKAHCMPGFPPRLGLVSTDGHIVGQQQQQFIVSHPSCMQGCLARSRCCASGAASASSCGRPCKQCSSCTPQQCLVPSAPCAISRHVIQGLIPAGTYLGRTADPLCVWMGLQACTAASCGVGVCCMLLYVLCMPCCLLQGVPASWHTWLQAWDAHPLCADVDWRQQCNITQDNPHAHQVTPSCIRYWTGQQLS
jgi:hypothetical protein